MTPPTARCSATLPTEKRAENDLALAALGPIVSGLILESHFESKILTEKRLRRILGRIFDALFPEHP